MAIPTNSSIPSRVAIVSSANDTQRRGWSQSLAETLKLPLLDSSQYDTKTYDLLFIVTDKRIELHETGQRAAGPVYVDFVSGSVAYRRISQGSRRQLIARAVGVRSQPLSVIDATAGLGQDAFMLACLGCTVTAIERSPLLFAMFGDGVERAKKTRSMDTQLQDILERITLIQGDAREVLKQADSQPNDPHNIDLQTPDVIYLDPMYPTSGKTALSKKEMRICRKLVGDDTDIDSLMAVAMEKTVKRIVVKRHLHAPPLIPKPSLCFKGKKIRYDVYLRYHKNK